MADYGVTEKTGAAVQAAIDRAHAAGGGRVCLEPGEYPTGTLYLKSNVELHLPAGARLVGFPDPARYDEVDIGLAPEGFHHCLLAAVDQENIAVTGAGEINGSGPAFYDRDTLVWERFWAKPPTPRPFMVKFHRCRRVRLEGVSLIDSPGWTVWLRDCEDVRINGLRVVGDQRMINNDGIDLQGCRRVVMSDCLVSTGDDALIVRAHTAPGERAVCEDIAVTNCVLESACQAIRVGCPADDVIRRCVFSNLVCRGSGNGVHFDNPKRYVSFHGAATRLDCYDMRFDNLLIETKGMPIAAVIEDGLELRRLAHITFSGCRIRSGRGIVLRGSSATWLDDFRFRDVTLITSDPQPLIVERVRNLSLDGWSVQSPSEPAE